MKRILIIFLIVLVLSSNAFLLGGCQATEAAVPDEMRACWVSSVGNLDFPSKQGLSAAELRKEIDAIIDTCSLSGLNAIFFQVRPCGDALYKSEIFPWSAYLTGKQGVAPENGFDPLEYFIKAAHRSKIELHAWINPYRISTESDMKQLSKNNPARLNERLAICSENGIYYDPANPLARELILSGIEEIITRYDVDGIHFDDYFYPYDLSGFDDRESYQKYGAGRTLADFRRDAVNQLVFSAYSLIKGTDAQIKFGISPFGIWANQSSVEGGSATNGMSAYSAIYADSKKWVEEGWLDYICPQLYWNFEHTAAPYDVLVDWWDSLCSAYKTDLYIGIGLYKIGGDEAGWEDSSVVLRQLKYACNKASYAGHCFFRYKNIEQNIGSIKETLKEYYHGTETSGGQKGVSLKNSVTLNEAEGLTIQSPQNGAVLDSNHISVSGTAPAGQEVLINGLRAVIGNKGFYSGYIPLKSGNNAIEVQSGDETKTIYVYRRSNKTDNAQDLTEIYPQGVVECGSGNQIHFSAKGPSEAKLMLKNDLVEIEMKEISNGCYEAEWTLPAAPMEDKLLLKDFVYILKKGGEKKEFKADLEIHCAFKGISEPMFLTGRTHIFDESLDGSQMDYDPMEMGSAVTVCGRENERSFLNNGYWVQNDRLSAKKQVASPIARYEYEWLKVSSDCPIAYSTEWSKSALGVSLLISRNKRFEFEKSSEDLRIEAENGNFFKFLKIQSISMREIAGYEVYPCGNEITIYLRFYQRGIENKVIALDAGHGGDDGGANGPGGDGFPCEADLNSRLTLLLKKELEKRGAIVYLTRTREDYLSLEERVCRAEQYMPDLFVSIHHNSSDIEFNQSKASGGLVLYSSPLSEAAARKIAECASAEKWKADVRRQSLHVCRQTRYPAVLIEGGYLCNPIEYEMLCEEQTASKIAMELAQGIESYFVTVCS